MTGTGCSICLRHRRRGVRLLSPSVMMAVLAFASAIALVAQSKPGAGEPGSYRFVPATRLEVKTGKAGLFGFAGHEHLIRAGAFEGEVRYLPTHPESTTIRIRVPAESLEVLTPPDTEEIRKVTAAMREQVLEVSRFPEILFVSRSVTATRDGYRVVADFTLHGQTREVPVDVQVEFRGDTLVAKSRFTLEQTDFGITPFRGGPGGTVRVADEVEFRINAVAVREGG